MPWLANMEWRIEVPKMDTDLNDFQFVVNYSLEEKVGENSYWWSNTVIIDESNWISDLNCYILDGIDFDIPEAFTSRAVTMRLNVSLEHSNTDDLVSLYIVKGMITGHETIYKMSNIYPSDLRARMFSTNFLYYFTQNAYGVGATNNSDPYADWKINDVWYQLEECSDPYAENLVEVLDVWDWGVYYSDMMRYMAVEQWDYDEETGTCEELDNLFHNDNNKGTYAEFFENDTRGLSMAKLKFKDEIMENVTDPVKFSGILNLYDVYDYIQPSTHRDHLLKSKKITVVVFPSVWNTTNERMILSTGEGQDANTISTDVLDMNISVLGSANTTKDISMTYYSAANTHDIQIDNWGDKFLKPNAENINNFPDDIFYDDRNYINYGDRVSAITTPFSDIGKIVESEYHIPLEHYSLKDGGFLSQDVDFNIDGLYSINDHLDQGDYKWFEMPIYWNNVSVIDNVTIKFIGNGGTAPDDITIDLLNYTGYYQEQISVDITNFLFEKVVIETYFCENVTTTPNWETFIGIPWLGMYHKNSIGQLNVEFTNTDTETVELLPTFFTEQISPVTIHHDFNVSDTILENYLSSIEIVAPKWFESELEVYSMNILNESLNTSVKTYYYSYYFDNYQVQFQKMISSIYSPRVESFPIWIVENNETSKGEYVKIPWSYEIKYDFMGDANYDIAVQFFDGEGKGNEYDSGHDTTYFENGVRDSILYDIGADGTWDFQEKWNNYISVFNSTPVNTFDTGDNHYFISRSQAVKYEFWADLTGDGMFNEMQSLYFIRTLEKSDDNLGKISAIPNYREFYSSANSEIENYFEELTTDYDWSNWISGIIRSCDINGDGIWEETINRQDLFPNDDWVMDDMHEHMIYETYDAHYIDQVPIYNETDPEQIIGYEFEDTFLRGNSLATNASFRLLGADPVNYEDFDNFDWLDDLDDNTEYIMDYQNITGEFVFIYDVPVLIDPRTSISHEQRVDEHGVQAWYDSNNDGVYEICYEFTEESWDERLAVAVYISRSGLPIVLTDPDEYKSSGDTVVATHWLSDKYDFEDIMGIAWDSAEEDGWDKYVTADFWVMWLTDTAAACVIMFALGALSLAPYVAIPLAAAMFLEYRLVVRPMLQDAFEVLCMIEGEQGHELNKPPEHVLNRLITPESSIDKFLWFASYFEMFPVFDVWNDMQAWYAGNIIPTYDMRANFADADPFYQDLNPEEFDYEDDWHMFSLPDLSLHEDALVWVNYQIPQFYDSMSNGPQEMEWINIFGMLKHIFTGVSMDLLDWFGIFNALDPSGLQAGVPNYVVMGFTWFSERAPLDAYFGEIDYFNLSDEDSIFSEDNEFLNAQRLMIDLLSAYHRHIMHQYFWRDNPTGEIDFWDEAGDPDENWQTLNEVGRIETELQTYSEAGYDSVSFMVDEKGAPFLTATYGQELNYSDPNVYAIDYNMMCMISKYQTGYQAGLKSGFGLWWTNTGLIVAQTILGLLAGAAGALTVKASAAESASVNSFEKMGYELLTMPAGLKTVSVLKNLVKEVCIELIVEEAFQGIFSFINMPDAISESLAEAFGDASVNFGSKIFNINTETQNFPILKRFSQTIRLYLQQQLRIQLMAGFPVSTINEVLSNPSLYEGYFKMLSAFQAAKITDPMKLKTSFIILSNAESFKGGGSQNGMSWYKMIATVLDSDTLKYDNLQMTKEGHKALIHFSIVQIALSNNRDIGKINLLHWEEGGLGLGDDGFWRGQHIEFWKPGTNERVAITWFFHADGSSSLVAITTENGIITDVDDLTNIMEGTGMRDFVWWLKEGYQFDMFDPIWGTRDYRGNILPVFTRIRAKDPRHRGDLPIGTSHIYESFYEPEINPYNRKDWTYLPEYYEFRTHEMVSTSILSDSITHNINNVPQVPYARAYISGRKCYSKPVEVDQNRAMPIEIDIDYIAMGWTNAKIFNMLFPLDTLDINVYGNNFLPYRAVIHPSFLEFQLKGIVKVLGSHHLKFQFAQDRTTHDIYRKEYGINVVNAFKTFLFTIDSPDFRSMFRKIGNAYNQYAFWDNFAMLTKIIDVTGQVSLISYLNDAGTEITIDPSEYFYEVRNLGHALDVLDPSGKLADFFIWCLTSDDPLSDILVREWRSSDHGINTILGTSLSQSQQWDLFKNRRDFKSAEGINDILKLFGWIIRDLHTNPPHKWDGAGTIMSFFSSVTNLAKYFYGDGSSLELIKLFEVHNFFNDYGTQPYLYEQAQFVDMLMGLIMKPYDLMYQNWDFLISHPELLYDIGGDHFTSPKERFDNFIITQAPNVFTDFNPATDWNNPKLRLLDYSEGTWYFGAFGRKLAQNTVTSLGNNHIAVYDSYNEVYFGNTFIDFNRYDQMYSAGVLGPKFYHLKSGILKIISNEFLSVHNLPADLDISALFDIMVYTTGGVFAFEGLGNIGPAYAQPKNDKAHTFLDKKIPMLYFADAELDSRHTYGYARRYYMRHTIIGNQFPMFYYRAQASELIQLFITIRNNPALKQALFGGNKPNLLQFIQNLYAIKTWVTVNDPSNQDYQMLQNQWIDEIINVFGLDVNGQFIVDADGNSMAEWFQYWSLFEEYLVNDYSMNGIFWRYITQGWLI